MASRPVYIPSRKRSRGGEAKARLHGAFEGGFSAGFHNTVGSEQGWEPNITIRTQQQKPEDYMDEQDFNEWGGPKSVRPEFQQETESSKSTFLPPSQKSLLDAMIVVKPPMNIGRQLLRILGWRDGSNTAYVPSHAESPLVTISALGDPYDPQSADQMLSKMALSQKKLRKIQLQQKRVRIPPIKHDTCGLGFVPLENAPEFRAARERRQRQARERALAAVQGNGRNVYRVSNLLSAGNQKLLSPAQGEKSDVDPYNNSYETTEDFVGSKSVGGFALREDEDDVYDDNNMQLDQEIRVLDHDQFDTVAYEHESDPDEGDIRDSKQFARASKRTSQELSGLLSTWMTGKDPDEKADSRNEKSSAAGLSAMTGLTPDARLHQTGFVMGTSSLPSQKVQRYPGPTIPANYEVGRHVFAPEHLPSTLQVLSRAVQLEMVDERKRVALHEALEVNAAANAPGRQRDDKTPMAGTTFSALAEAMKNRFRPSETQSGADKTQNGKKEESKDRSTVDEKKEIKITRTVMTFVPTSLLCKRFHVAKGAGAGAEPQVRMSEATYFQTEILNTAQNVKSDEDPQSNQAKVVEKNDIMKLVDDAADFEVEARERPSMEVYKSIYEPESEPSSESEDDGASTKEESRDMTVDTQSSAELGAMSRADFSHVDTKSVIGEATQSETINHESPEHGTATSLGDPGARSETSLVPYEPLNDERDEKRQVVNHTVAHQKRRSRSRSHENSVSSSETNSEMEERRRKRHRKERKRERRRREERKKKRKKESKSDRKRERKSYSS